MNSLEGISLGDAHLFSGDEYYMNAYICFYFCTVQNSGKNSTNQRGKISN